MQRLFKNIIGAFLSESAPQAIRRYLGTSSWESRADEEPSRASMDDEDLLKGLGPLYHGYSFFGVANEQLPGMYELNQQAKAPIITAYLAYAIAKSRNKATDPVSFIELFCADGYYTMVASRLGCCNSIGIDNNRDGHLQKARHIADRLGIKSVTFTEQEITEDADFDAADVIANIGGLYHVNKPREILRLSYEKAKKFLIVQTVVSLASTDENYFEAPAPGWTWGNRYSRESFDKMIHEVCPGVIDCHYNELEGNGRPEDRGSVYYLIRK